MFVSSLTALVLTMSVAQDAAEPAPETAAGSAPAPQLQLDIAPPRTEGMVRRSAGQYAAYHGVVADLREAPIGSGDDLDMAMDRLSAFYGEDRLAPAWIAYAGVTLQFSGYFEDLETTVRTGLPRVRKCVITFHLAHRPY